MKKFLLSIALAICLPAQAGIMATIPTAEGAATIILLEERHDCPETALKAVILYEAKIRLTGCWLYQDGTIFVLWDDNREKVYSYPAASARLGAWADKPSSPAKPKRGKALET